MVSDRLVRPLAAALLLVIVWVLWNSDQPQSPWTCHCPVEDRVLRSPPPDGPPEELYLLPPPPADPTALAAALFTYIDWPQRWCRRLAMLGGQSGEFDAIDGNKFVCMDASRPPRPPCLVYSFGSRDDWSFERDVIRELRCEVHTFDPSLAANASRDTHGARFHAVGLGGVSRVTSRGWRLMTLGDIRRQLGHAQRDIAYLKVDIEGGEWEWLETEAETLSGVAQIGMEVHLSALTPHALRRVYRVFWRLQEAGFRTVFSEVNRVWGRTRHVHGVDGKVGNYYEMVWVQTH